MVAVYNTVLLIGTLAVFALSIPLLSKAGGRIEKNTLAVGLGFGLLLYLEFFVLGPASFIHLDNEGDTIVPIYNYISNLTSGETYSHGFAGGNDLYAMLMSGMQYFSIEKILISTFPVWLAISIHKYLIFLIGISGAYLLARRVSDCSKFAALSIALLFAAFFLRQIDFSIAHGAGRSIFPLAIYICVCRLDDKRYFTGVFAFSLLAATVTPTHVYLPMVFGIVLAALLLGRVRLVRLAAALLVLTAAVLANWHEVLYAMKQIVPYTMRGQRGLAADPLFWDSISAALRWFLSRPVPSLVIILGFAVLVGSKDRRAFHVGLTMIALVIGFAVFNIFPWDAVGLGFAKGVDFFYALDSLNGLFVPVAAWTAGLLENGSLRQYRLGRLVSPGGVFLAAAVASMVWFKGLHLSEFLYYGGQSQYFTIENLTNKDWAPDKPFRVITLRHRRPEPLVVAGFYGLDTYDGTLNLTPASVNRYWNQGIKIKPGQAPELFPRVMLDLDFWDPEKKVLDVAGYIDERFLGIANVGFIISPVPLRGGGLVKVSGPDDATYALRHGLKTTAEYWGFLRHRLKKIIRVGKVYIYRIPRSLPRVYAAAGIEQVGATDDTKDVLRKIGEMALKKTIVVSRLDAALLGKPQGQVQILDYASVRNGYDIAISAPTGGILVVNAAYLPFWKAMADGRQIPLVEANMIHMAMAVPPGSKTVTLRYDRPLLRDLVATNTDE